MIAPSQAPPYEPTGPVARSFHRSSAFVRGLMGPVGSSKSSACWMELVSRAFEQKPNASGVRRTKTGVIRNTYPELKSTTIKTVLEWAPWLEMRWDSPITGRFRHALPDGTSIDWEVVFIALERPEEVDKIGSLELTNGWINEVREVAKSIADKLTERVGRFPPKWDGGATWSGVVMDTNPPDDDHWYYRLAERADPELLAQTEAAEEKLRAMGELAAGQHLFEFFRQPGGLVRIGEQYEPNPDAENILNLNGGYAYYLRQVAGKRREWVNAQILGQYATTVDGKPVYPEYADATHTRPTPVLPRIPIICGWDYARSPACAFVQVSPRGQLRVIDELWADDMGLEAFAEDVVKPHIGMAYRDHEIVSWGDPSGVARESDEKNAFDVLAAAGITCLPALTNKPQGRQEAVRHFLGRMLDGQPGLSVDPKCVRVRKGFIGRYFFKRVQVAGEMYKDMPEKNEYSHIHDALQYACLAARLEYIGGASFKKKLAYPDLGISSTRRAA